MDPESTDVRKMGYLRKQKSTHKRFFVLREGQGEGPRLEYHESEKKWRSGTPPRRSLPLSSCLAVARRSDSRHRHLLAIYTRNEYLAVAAENEAEQDAWYAVLSETITQGQDLEKFGAEPWGESLRISGNGTADGSTAGSLPRPAFREVWQVNLKPKGLGQSRNLTGIYRLCLGSRSISFVKLSADAPAVSLQLMNIRRCGHSENFFFIEVGRSAATGPGEFWMQADDCAAAQNMHETILEAMKAMSEEFRPRSKSQTATGSTGTQPSSSSSTSQPISVPGRRRRGPPQPGHRSRAESLGGSSSTARTALQPPSSTDPAMERVPSPCPQMSSRPESVDVICPRPESGSPRGRGSQTLSGRRASQRAMRPQPALSLAHGPGQGHSRSVSAPLAHRSPPPALASPVSASSSSGRGSADPGGCPSCSSLGLRPSSSSVCGSLSDGGFVSSDEFAASPGEPLSILGRSSTPESPSPAGASPPDESCLYMHMDGRAGGSVGVRHLSLQTRTGKAGVAGMEGVTGAVGGLGIYSASDHDKTVRKRTYSCATGSLAATTGSCSPQPSVGSMDEYAEMGVGHESTGGTPDLDPSPRSAETAYGMARHPGDDGYMPMQAGVAVEEQKQEQVVALGAGYVIMGPMTAASHPQEILHPRVRTRDVTGQGDSAGYVLMSPYSSGIGRAVGRNSYSPEPVVQYTKTWPRVGGMTSLRLPHGESPDSAFPSDDYIDMSPVSPIPADAPPTCCIHKTEASNSATAYYSLPRSFRPVIPTLRGSTEDIGSQKLKPGRLSLKGRDHRVKASPAISNRPTEPKSPGEYVHIEYCALQSARPQSVITSTGQAANEDWSVRSLIYSGGHQAYSSPCPTTPTPPPQVPARRGVPRSPYWSDTLTPEDYTEMSYTGTRHNLSPRIPPRPLPPLPPPPPPSPPSPTPILPRTSLSSSPSPPNLTSGSHSSAFAPCCTEPRGHSPASVTHLRAPSADPSPHGHLYDASASNGNSGSVLSVPAEVSGQRLNYVSLDLGEEGTAGSRSSVSSLDPSQYASIDFRRSES
uniref:insulin receptor substrate 1-like n=1 Tax=Myxine glutinosa TaxID=7769 RepID=UPI00358F5C40